MSGKVLPQGGDLSPSNSLALLKGSMFLGGISLFSLYAYIGSHENIIPQIKKYFYPKLYLLDELINKRLGILKDKTALRSPYKNEIYDLLNRSKNDKNEYTFLNIFSDLEKEQLQPLLYDYETALRNDLDNNKEHSDKESYTQLKKNILMKTETLKKQLKNPAWLQFLPYLSATIPPILFILLPLYKGRKENQDLSNYLRDIWHALGKPTKGRSTQ